MKRLFASMLLFLLVIHVEIAISQERTIAFYSVKATEIAPVIDGDLNDPAWVKADIAQEAYEYWTVSPGPGKLQTDFRLLYNGSGIYVGIFNHDKNAEKIKATKTERDDELWLDDSVEVYFDPAATAVGYLKFIINPLGARYDARRFDVANTFVSWNPEGWEVKAAKNKDGWTAELFFSWSVLGGKPVPGDVWMFDLTRFSYPNGEFVGTTWSPGGNYNMPQYFGYVYFQGSEAVTPEKMGEVLRKKILPPWKIRLEKGYWICDEKGTGRLLTFTEIINDKTLQIDHEIQKVEQVAKQLPNTDKVKKLNKEFSEIKTSRQTLPVDPVGRIRTLETLQNQIQDLYWQSMIEKLLENN